MKSWVIVPAAGAGKRFSLEARKQYAKFLDMTVLEYTLKRLLAIDHIKIVVAVSPEDKAWRQLAIFKNTSIEVIFGGKERADSVLLALEHIKDEAEMNDWVLVHDGVRPCVKVADIINLMDQLSSHAIGGILAVPVVATIKRATSKAEIKATEDRSRLWEAQTPQMFRFSLLLEGLRQASRANWQPTDESAAIENLGHMPRIIEGSHDNIKITRREDIVIAEAIALCQQEWS